MVKSSHFAYVYEVCHTHISKATDKTGMEKDMGYKRSRSCGDVGDEARKIHSATEIKPPDSRGLQRRVHLGDAE